MQPVTRRTDAELEFAIADCQEVIRGNVTMENLVKYGREMGACQDELRRRNRIRAWRHDVKVHLYDILTTPVRSRRWRYTDFTAFRRDRWRSGAMLLGWYRLYNTA